MSVRSRAEKTGFTHSPPGSVGLVMLELPRQEDSNEDLEDTSLDADDGNETENRVRSIPELQEPLRTPISDRKHDRRYG